MRWTIRPGLVALSFLGVLLATSGCTSDAGQAQAASSGKQEQARPDPHASSGPDSGDSHLNEATPHEHPPAASGEEAGAISLSPEARANIGLETFMAKTHPIERILTLNATLQVDPDREAFVSSRVQGKVVSVGAKVGDRVTKGQTLVVLQSLQIAETPATVEVPSPLDGVVLERTVTTGETIDPTTSLLHIADLTRLIAQAEVYESDLGLVRLGQTARIRVAAFPNRVFTGRVIRVADAIDPERRTLRIWIDVANTRDRLLKANMFSQVSLVVASSGRAVVVPNEAVQTQGPERFVFVQNGDQLVRQNVVTGERNDQYTAITSGIIEGDEVVTRGAVELATLSSQPAGGGLQDESKPHSH